MKKHLLVLIIMIVVLSSIGVLMVKNYLNKKGTEQTTGDFDFDMKDFRADLYIVSQSGDTLAHRISATYNDSTVTWELYSCPEALDRMCELLIEEYHWRMPDKKHKGHELPILIKSKNQ